ncbi:contact-dependent growth inhibition system immunity protein [Flavobacterium restrictum]|uniref:DUF1436 family protein n=1 Tax=Flavobacterium restrictum TaxID=2594428 RepID=A0A553DSY8_9FLAO|nr:contact-dependent growth inhibition system immunity protein [Flavobacterium restrictum]TRX35898.1 DUF1436 family protein [Flavobacterium restrictum]
MTKSVVIKRFLKDNKYIIHPNLVVKDSGSYAIPPYITEYNLNSTELLDKILYALEFSKEGGRPVEDPKTRHQEFLKAMGVKTMKALHDNTINLSLYVRDGIVVFVPWENKGSKEGFSGFKEDLTVKLPFNSPKEELVKALELALSRCK